MVALLLNVGYPLIRNSDTVPTVLSYANDLYHVGGNGNTISSANKNTFTSEYHELGHNSQVRNNLYEMPNR